MMLSVRWNGTTAVTAIAILAIVAAIAVPVTAFTRMKRAEDAAEAAMSAIAQAQRTFRANGGRGGYATSVASLTDSCADGTLAPLRELRTGRYTVTMRAARGARTVGVDCHGRPAVSDYYAAAAPSDAWAGRLAFALTARGRVYAFFDGIAPLENDMGGRDLAVPLDLKPPFRIP
jgi:type II secretory pathway pseudopilin PulG